MTIVKTCAGLAVLVSLGGAAMVEARPGDDRFPIDIERVEARQAQHFDVLDQNNDNQVSLTEFEQSDFGPGERAKRKHGGRKAGMHRDHGKRQGFHGGPDRKDNRQAMREARDKELFAILDSNADGALSPAEYSARNRDSMRLAHKRAVFAQLDSNNDGHLTADEMPSRADRLKAADADADGKVTRQELRALRQQGKQAG